MSNFGPVTNSGINSLHMGDVHGGTVNNSGTAHIQVKYDISAMKSEFEEGLNEILKELRNNPNVSTDDLNQLFLKKNEITTVLNTSETQEKDTIADKVGAFADTLHRIVESTSSASKSGEKLIALVHKAAPILITGIGSLVSYLSN